ncbi:MAG TPA: tetratricopeptide repeat protein [Candidatus Binatia bacterium]
MSAERSSRSGGSHRGRAAGGLPGEVFTTRQIARLTRLSPSRVRRCIRAGFLSPSRGPRRRYEYSLRDLMTLRAARAMFDAGYSPRRVAEVLARLRQQVEDREPSSLTFSIDRGRVVVADGTRRWYADSGQLLLRFDGSSRDGRRSRVRALDDADSPDEREAQRAFDRALALEDRSPEAAKEAYRRVLEYDAFVAPAHINLGRLEHESGNFAEAERHYLAALALSPDEPTTLFNLALLAEDRGDLRLAVRRYQHVLNVAPDLADAHQRLSNLYLALGDRAAARRHLQQYRRLLRRR